VADGSVEFFGETFALPERVGSMPLMRFAKLAQQGVQTDDFEGLAAMYDLIEACLSEADWPRFQACATANRATDEELLAVVAEVMVAMAGRPTSRPSVSSDGPSVIAPNFTSTPAERAIAQLDGRPDLQLLVRNASEQLAKAN
jgi:hypothetical protein